MKRFRLHTSLALALLLPAMITLGAIWHLSGRLAAGAAQELTVCPRGCYYATIQAAVDAAREGDVIKVAGGTYNNVQGRQAPIGYPDPPASGVISQVVYIDKSVTLRGGYSTAFGDPPDPQVYTTTLDARGEGRVLCAIGEISPTIEGLSLIRGNATGLGGNPWGGDAGGGVYVISAAATLSNSRVISNSAEYGGGLFLAHSGATLVGNHVSDNSADKGAGLYLYHSDTSLSDNTVVSNHAGYGGGLLLWSSDATLDHNTIANNSAESWGGGLYLSSSAATLSSNTIADNSARGDGGGLSLFYSPATLSANTVVSNTTGGGGGGLSLLYSGGRLSDNTIRANAASNGSGGGLLLRNSAATLGNNVISDNSAGFEGGGLYLTNSAATLNGNSISANSAQWHGGGLYLLSSGNATLSSNTIAGNSAGGDGGGLYLADSAATLSDNIVSTNSAKDATGGGGGLSLWNSAATLSENIITANSAEFWGGGLFLEGSPATLSGNTVSTNSAAYGGGLFLWYRSDATMTNNIVAENQVEIAGSGLYIKGSSPHLLHTTLARNRGGDGSGIAVTDYWGHSKVSLINSMLVGHSVGISVTARNKATLTGTLWGSGVWANGVDVGGGGTVVTGTPDVRGAPGFVDPDGGDYHIGPDSAAIDAGVETGIRTDLDGQPRPYRTADLGADEYWPPGELGFVFLPVVLRGAR